MQGVHACMTHLELPPLCMRHVLVGEVLPQLDQPDQVRQRQPAKHAISQHQSVNGKQETGKRCHSGSSAPFAGLDSRRALLLLGLLLRLLELLQTVADAVQKLLHLLNVLGELPDTTSPAEEHTAKGHTDTGKIKVGGESKKKGSCRVVGVSECVSKFFRKYSQSAVLVAFWLPSVLSSLLLASVGCQCRCLPLLPLLPLLTPPAGLRPAPLPSPGCDQQLSGSALCRC